MRSTEIGIGVALVNAGLGDGCVALNQGDGWDRRRHLRGVQLLMIVHQEGTIGRIGKTGEVEVLEEIPRQRLGPVNEFRAELDRISRQVKSGPDTAARPAAPAPTMMTRFGLARDGEKPMIASDTTPAHQARGITSPEYSPDLCCESVANRDRQEPARN
jgi:hypothetical protein